MVVMVVILIGRQWLISRSMISQAYCTCSQRVTPAVVIVAMVLVLVGVISPEAISKVRT